MKFLSKLAAVVEDDGMAAFREAYFGQMVTERMITGISCLSRRRFILKWILIFSDGVVRMSGDLSWTYTNVKKNYSTNNSIPFYIEQNENDLTLYVQRVGKWSKMTLPELPAGIIAMWKSSDSSMLVKNFDAVKKVTIFSDTANLNLGAGNGSQFFLE